MICCELGLDWVWEWALTRKSSMVRSEADVIACHRYLGRIASRTPPYLDPQSQEAVHEVDVSGMPININFNWNQSGHTEGSMDEGRMYE
jgi:hypothetical protein